MSPEKILVDLGVTFSIKNIPLLILLLGLIKIKKAVIIL